MTEQLLHALERRVNQRGRAIATEHSLLEELRLAPDMLAGALRRLEEASLIEVLSPLPFLVVRLRSWSNNSRNRALSEQRSSSSHGEAHSEVPVSSAAAAATQQREVGGAGEGDELLDQVLSVLGAEANREEFRQILAKHHPLLIHRALKRVQATKRIRVSKTALFRSLLHKLGN